VIGPASVVLVGRRVRLEPLMLDHAPALAAAAARDRSTFALTRVPDGVEQARAYIEDALDEAERGWARPFATTLAESGEVVGSTRFMDLQYWAVDERPPGVPVVAEIGATWLTASVQRTPVNTEAKYLLLRHAFEVWRVQRVSLKTDARNARSRAAIERLGARFDGVLRRFSPAADAGLRDAAFFSILDSEWPTVKWRLESFLASRLPASPPS
jgi:RimJ/RimL family protein N-acetyltransferase